MATIIFDRNLKSINSDLVSAYNNNVILVEFIPDDGNKVITLQLELTLNSIVHKFKCYKYSSTTIAGITRAKFRIDLKDIIRYFITDYYYKYVSSGLNVSRLASQVTLTFKGYENITSTKTETLTLYFGHGVNQIGYEHGGNLRYLFYNEDLRFVAFDGYPFEVYYFHPVAGAANLFLNNEGLSYITTTKGMKSVKYTSLNAIGRNIVDIYMNTGTDLITGWSEYYGLPFSSFDSTANNVEVTQRIDIDNLAYTNNISLVAGQTYAIYINVTFAYFTPIIGIGLASGIPNLGTTVGHNISVVSGVNNVIYTAPTTGQYVVYLRCTQGVYMQSIVATVVVMSESSKQNITLDVYDSCEGVYIRYLSKEGFYRYFLFNKYFKSRTAGQKIGDIIPYMDNMVDAQSQKQNIGFEDVYETIEVTAEKVSKEDQILLVDIFTSPAVYLWSGKKGESSKETDWILINIEGSHTIVEKNKFQTVNATLRLPEKYTQMR